jgi:hypothetical protein
MSPEYLAGIFDGEGCIDVQRMYPKKSNGCLYVRPRVRMCMANSANLVLHGLHGKFGGHLTRRKAPKPTQQDSWSLEWLSKAAIRDILHVVLPHLILKAEQAKLVLWWLDNASGKQIRNTRFGTTDCFAGIGQARVVFCEELRVMKQDPQRLSERAEQRIGALMR